MTLSTKRIFPIGPEKSKILVIGESPGEDEEREGIPFIGKSGSLLWDAFRRYGVKREEVRATNLCNYKPEGNKWEYCEGTVQLAEGLQEIDNYIIANKPNVIAAVGGQALKYITGRFGILAHRSSILSHQKYADQKVVSTIHPSYVHRIPEAYLFFDFDVRRVVEESQSSLFNYTQRNYHLRDYCTKDDVEKIVANGIYSIDIESTIEKETGRIIPISISFSPDIHNSYVYVWSDANYPFFKSLSERKDTTKIFHYGYCFDIELLYLYGINVDGLIHDTYLMAGVLDPGLPKSLAFLTTTYTREPYYKKQGRDTLPDDTKVWGSKTKREDVLVYNGKDTAVTIEIFYELQKYLQSEGKWNKYLFKLRCARELGQSISRNGMLLDQERNKLFEKALVYKWTRFQQVLNMMAGRTVNVNSTQGKKSIQHLLYTELGLPPRRNYKTGSLKADEKALLSLIAFCQGEVDSKKTETAIAQWTLKREIVKTILDIRQLRKMISSYITMDISVDGRVRSVYNVGATETGRWGANKYVDDTGFNSMTLPRGDIIIPDDLPEGDIDHNAIVAQLREEMKDEVEDEEV